MVSSIRLWITCVNPNWNRPRMCTSSPAEIAMAITTRQSRLASISFLS